MAAVVSMAAAAAVSMAADAIEATEIGTGAGIGIGIAVGLVSLALIWTTRDMWAVLQRENAFNLARITLLEANLGRAEQELRTQKAYIDRYMTERGNQ